MLNLFGEEIPDKIYKNRNVFALLGASNHSKGIRQNEDYYATHPIAAFKLLELEEFTHDIWEPCAGECHIADVFTQSGFNVRKSDIIRRRDDVEIQDFMLCNEIWNGDIVTNPPYKIALPVVSHALSLLNPGRKLCMFLRTLFLESIERKKLFDITPPIRVWVSSERISCAKNGDFENGSQNAQSYSWFVWEKGYSGHTTLGWF